MRLRPELTSEGALRLLSHAKMEAEARQVEVSIAVVDRGGQLLAFLRMGDAAPVTICNALAKASTAAQLRMPSAALEEMVNQGRTSFLAIEGVVPLQGGVPVTSEGDVVGGIGCSGADSAIDEAIAQAACAVWPG